MGRIVNWVSGWFSKQKPLRQGDTALVVAQPGGPRHDEPPRGDLEKMSGGPAVILPYFLPFFDPQQTVGETALQRLAYRVMLADPTVKASLFAKIFGVAALELNVNPASDKPRDAKIADFVKWNLTQRIYEGLPGLVWSVFSGGLVDGYSVCEKVWGQQQIGRWEDKDVLRNVKAQDVDNDLVLNVDPHRNVVSIQGLRYNAGLVFDVKNFIIWRHLGMYNLPTGMSDLRAAYMSYWMLDTVRKLRAKGATKRAFPFIWGTYPDASKQPGLEAALAKINSQNWFSCPEGVQLQLLDVAGSASDYFANFCEFLQKEIALSIEGAVLQQQTGGVGQSRGATSGHKDTADLRKWWLSECFCHSVLNHEETGLIPEMVARNFAGVKEFPIATLGGVDAAELAEELKIDDGLSKLGFLQTAEDLGKRYGRKQAAPGEEVKPPQPMGPDGQPMGGDGANGGGGDDWLSKQLAAQGGENGNGNGKPPGENGESFAEWDESAHKRGQPGNPGQFGSGGGGAGSSSVTNGPPPHSLRKSGAAQPHILQSLSAGHPLSIADIVASTKQDPGHVADEMAELIREGKVEHKVIGDVVQYSLKKSDDDEGTGEFLGKIKDQMASDNQAFKHWEQTGKGKTGQPKADQKKWGKLFDELPGEEVKSRSRGSGDVTAKPAGDDQWLLKQDGFVSPWLVSEGHVRAMMEGEITGHDEGNPDIDAKKVRVAKRLAEEFPKSKQEAGDVQLTEDMELIPWDEDRKDASPINSKRSARRLWDALPHEHEEEHRIAGERVILKRINEAYAVARTNKGDPRVIGVKKLKPKPKGEAEGFAEHDVSRESRDASGRWTAGQGEWQARDAGRTERRSIVADIGRMMHHDQGGSEGIADSANQLAEAQMNGNADTGGLQSAVEAHIGAHEDYAAQLTEALQSTGADEKQTGRVDKAAKGTIAKLRKAGDAYLEQANVVANQLDAMAQMDDDEPDTRDVLPDDQTPPEPDEFEGPERDEWDAEVAKLTEAWEADLEKKHDTWEKDKDKLEARVEKDKARLETLEKKYDETAKDTLEAIDDAVGEVLAKVEEDVDEEEREDPEPDEDDTEQGEMFAEDASHHQHKGKGPGGGQFTSGAGGSVFPTTAHKDHTGGLLSAPAKLLAAVKRDPWRTINKEFPRQGEKEQADKDFKDIREAMRNMTPEGAQKVFDQAGMGHYGPEAPHLTGPIQKHGGGVPVQMHAVKGSAFKHKDAIKAAGGVWDSEARHWIVNDAGAAKIKDLPGLMVRPLTNVPEHIRSHLTGSKPKPPEDFAEGWDESKHPRGQPENKGEFGPGGGSQEKLSSREDVAKRVADWKEKGVKSSAFKSWFGDWEKDPKNASRVVNSAGKPQETREAMRVYHGRRKNFDTFKVGNSPGIVGFFSESKTYSQGYGDDVDEFYLNIRNPVDMGSDSEKKLTFDEWMDVLKKQGVDTSKINGRDEYYENDKMPYWALLDVSAGGAPRNTNLVSELRRQGFDGIMGYEGKARAWAAFEPTQIKGVDNAGTFDSNDPVYKHSELFAEPWDESKHKRGQPENAGQFGPGGASHQQAVKAIHAKYGQQIKDAKFAHNLPAVKTVASTKENSLASHEHTTIAHAHAMEGAEHHKAGRSGLAQANFAAARYHNEMGRTKAALEAAKNGPAHLPDDQVRSGHMGSSKDVKELKQQSKEWAKSLTDDEKESLENYTSDDEAGDTPEGYATLNKALRSKPNGSSLEPRQRQAVANLNVAIDKFGRRSKPVQVYRGIELDEEETAKFVAKFQKAMDEGKGVVLNGMTSTSLDPGVASGFGSGVVFEIAARTGAYLEGTVGGNKEHEFLQKHGTRYKVNAVNKRVQHESQAGKKWVKVIQLEEL